MAKDSPEMHKYKMRQKLKRQLWCAFYAEDALHKAKTTAEQYIDLKLTIDHPLSFTFVSSEAITYSRFFISSDTMITLPPAFEKFPTEHLKRTHEWVKTSRNTIYAHTDATAAPYGVKIHITEEEGIYRFDLEGRSVSMRELVFPSVIKLCDFQLARLQLHMQKLLDNLLPAETVQNLLSAEHTKTTTIEVFWPKPLDASMMVPPNTW